MAGHANFSLMAVLAAAAWLTGCSAQPASETKPPIVRIARVQPDSESASGDAYTGTVRARIESALGFRVPGKITERLVNSGDHVRAGQPLFRLDARDLGLAASSAADRVRAAEADAARTAADEARLRPLVATGAVSSLAYDGARAARDAAAANLASARSGSASAANQRGYATLFADADGVVTEVIGESGQVVVAGAPVLRLAQAGAREALVAVPETAVRRLPRSAVAEVYGSSAVMAASLREIAGAADPLTRTFAARYVLAGPVDAAPLGATISIRVSSQSTNAARIPLGALVDQGQGPGVWVIDAQQRTRFIAVKVLRLKEEEALVVAPDLSFGQRVVALGGQLLHEGQKVRIAAQGPSTQSARP